LKGMANLLSLPYPGITAFQETVTVVNSG